MSTTKGGQFDDPVEGNSIEKSLSNVSLSSSAGDKKPLMMNPNAKPFTLPAQSPPILEPRPLLSPQNSPALISPITAVVITYPCIVCNFKCTEYIKILEHMLKEHNLVIGEVEKIADLSKYEISSSFLMEGIWSFGMTS